MSEFAVERLEAGDWPSDLDLIRTLPSDQLYALEKAGEIARDVLDHRIRFWCADGWTQQAIASEIGIAQQNISKRLARLGLTTLSNRGRPTNYTLGVIRSDEPPADDIEVVDGEVVEPEHTPATSGSRTVAGVRFPRGGIAETYDVTEYNVKNLKIVAENLIRRATPKEAAALHKLFLKYAELTGRTT